MQKFRCLWWYGVIGTLTGAALFLMTSTRLLAAEVSSEEVFFFHTHGDSCYQTVTYSCESTHTCWKGYVEHKALHCSACGSTVNHKVVCDSWNCPTKNLYWQMNVVATCTVCGNVQPAWSNYNPAAHQTTGTRVACGLTEGEQTLGIRIVADATPTNSGVTLTVTENLLKEDVLIGTVTYDWGTSSRTVTENGTYSVIATDSKGRSVSTSVTISCIDKTVPVIQGITHDAASVTQGSVNVTVSATDGESGLADNAYSTDGGVTWSAQSSFTVSEGSDIQLVVRDKAGNTVRKTVKRSDYPYPPKPTPAPTPIPTPKPVYTPAPTTEVNAAGTGGIVNSPVPTPVGETASVTESETSRKDKESAKLTKQEDVLDENIKEAEETEKGEEEKTEQKEEEELVTVQGRVPLTPKPFLPNLQEGKWENSTVSDINSGAEAEMAVPVALYEKSSAFSDKADSVQGILHRIEGNGENTTEDAGASAFGFTEILRIGGIVVGGLAMLSLAVLLGKFFWMNSAVLYCYDGGDSYKKLGLFFLRKNEEDMELYLPEYLTESTDILRYRLLLKNTLVKKFAGKDLVVCSEDTRLRRPMEECVDFVL